VAAQLGALAGQRRGQDLELVAGGPAPAPALGAADDRDRVGLVQAQQLAEAQLQAEGDAGGDGERRRGLAALDLREHRGADAAALREVAQRQVHRLAQRADPRADLDLVIDLLVGDGHDDARTLSRTSV
jgi:hypothetical protein